MATRKSGNGKEPDPAKDAQGKGDAAADKAELEKVEKPEDDFTQPFEVKTRVTENDDPVTTKVTLDWTGCKCEPNALRAMVKATVVIRQQSIWRTSGFIPAKDTIVILDVANRKRAGFQVTPDSVAANLKKKGDAQAVQEMIAKLQQTLKELPKQPKA